MTEYRSAGTIGDAEQREVRALSAILNAPANRRIGCIIQLPHAELVNLGYGKLDQRIALFDKLVARGNAEEFANGRYKRVA